MRKRRRFLELSRVMVGTVRGSLIVGVLLLSSLALAQEKQAGSNVDSEHIFGFTEGADIGDKGESELESITVGRLGKQGGFSVLTNETSYRYGVEQSFRASVGTVTDYYSVHDTPGFLDRTGLRYSGLTSEFRWQFSEHDRAPIGLTLSFAPTWRSVNDPTPGQGQAYTLPVSLLADHVFIPNQLYAAVNVSVAPTFSSVAGLWQSTRPFELSAALAGALGDRIFLGGEVRWAAQNLAAPFADRALYIGPSLFVKLQENLTVKAAWSLQVPELFRGRMDLTNYERHQVLLQFAYGF
jgi:hypothetical protein